MSSTINDVRVAPGESAEAKRERRLQRRRERERAHGASETAETRMLTLSTYINLTALYTVHTPRTRSGSPHNVWHFSSIVSINRHSLNVVMCTFMSTILSLTVLCDLVTTQLYTCTVCSGSG